MTKRLGGCSQALQTNVGQIFSDQFLSSVLYIFTERRGVVVTTLALNLDGFWSEF